MMQTVVRTYEIDEQDVREAILMWVRSKNLPVPQYIGNTAKCRYTHNESGSVIIEWTEEGPVEP